MTPVAEQAARAVGRAAGYCWEPYQGGKARRTRAPHDDRQHVDHYTGRTSLTDVHGVTWTS
ncbi:hypothetical protein ACH41H_29035 [Streptomyces sp. NPDC020800]|uniref:hypothetical protein n=1 Tax=Streptomyces sp. NPDC020800 TaxID=3365092 RepID=UPI00379B175E